MRLVTIADHHFGHKNMLKFEPEHRKFKDVYEMNTFMADEWNKYIEPNDIVFYLGDFSLTGRYYTYYLLTEKLNGQKILIVGNHDRKNHIGWQTRVQYIFSIDNSILLIHNPGKLNSKSWLLENKLVDEHLKNGIIKKVYHGHIHHKKIFECDWWEQFKYKDIEFINAGIEATNYKPIILEKEKFEL